MPWLTAVLILTGVPFAFALQGAWLARRLELPSAGLRLATATLAGLTITLWEAGTLNLLAPLSGWPLGLLLVPALPTLLHRPTRTGLFADGRAVFANPAGLSFGAGLIAFLALLLWPAWRDASLVYADGTSNHDAFFWILGADFVREHASIATTGTPPASGAATFAGAIAGWFPSWGRFGAEGYLATVAGFAHTRPLGIYLWASAALFFAWVAAVYGIVRTFIADQLGWGALVALALFQPLFAFYHHNANLPNLLGVLAGATAALATEWTRRAVAAGTQKPIAAVAIFAFAWHAVIVAYPEIAPFIALPCVLLAVRKISSVALVRRTLTWLAAGFLAALLANPLLTVRAGNAFIRSLQIARFESNWANIVTAAGPGGFLPALVTLSTKTGHELGVPLGVVATLLIALGAFATWRRARDRYGLASLLAGAGILSVYTLATGFVYGWQKTAQFSGVFLAAVFPVGLAAVVSRRRAPRWQATLTTGALAAFFGFTLTVVQLDLLKWSGRKSLHADWANLGRSTALPPGATVTIDAATFRQPFFYGMWSAYFLRTQPFRFAARGGTENTGYLRDQVAVETTAHARDAVLVSREWAETVVPDAPRLAVGREFALLSGADRMLGTEGVAPQQGVPQTVAPHFTLRVLASRTACLAIAIAPPVGETAAGVWVAQAIGSPSVELRGDDSGWRAVLPLLADGEQVLEFEFRPAVPARTSSSLFPLTQLRFVHASQ
ncbi:MAG: hypothetical protein KF715_07025 [Candidatus Didemnitutus sp.]|nr:hypothetical protein [Candidatus Didemnitutus sp.]